MKIWLQKEPFWKSNNYFCLVQSLHFTQEGEKVCRESCKFVKHTHLEGKVILNPLIPDIKMHILITVLHTFLIELVRRICLNIKTSSQQWSLPLFLSLEHSNKQWSCKEKFHFHRGLELRVRFFGKIQIWIPVSKNGFCVSLPKSENGLITD